MHLDDRISLEPGSPKRGQKMTVEYRGLLAQSGADNLWMHYGFDGWKNEGELPMEPTSDGNFTCQTEVQGKKEFNFCFKDSANNWDNNNGHDWYCKIE